MEGNEKELAMVKTMLRSVLMSSKEGVPAHVLQRDYREQTFESLPFQKFGFRNLDAFIESMPDVVRIKHTPSGEIYHAVADESTAHISKMVSKQRTSKKRKSLKPARRRPAPRSAPFHSPWTQQHRIFLPPLNPWPGKRPTKSPQHKHHLTIHSEAGGRRRVNLGSQPRALTKAMSDANEQRQSFSSQSRFEVPPRFRKKQEEQIASQPPQPSQKSMSPRTSSPILKTPPRKTNVQPIDLAKVKDGKRYYDLLVDYCRSHHVSDLKFETMPSRVQQVYCYASSTKINDRVYGSGDLFGSSVEAEFAACRTACVEIGLLTDSDQPAQNHIPEINTSEDDQKVRSRIKEILATKQNGLWSSRLPIEYKEKYKEDLPSNVIDLIKTWKDIAVVEFNSLTKREVLYPVKEEDIPQASNHSNHIPQASNHSNQAVLPDIPLPVQESDQRKDFKIPQGKPLPIGEKVTVYTTFIHSVTWFCVQREDSPIDEIGEDLTTLVKDSLPEEVDLTKGRFVAALYDESWYRAEILSENPINSVIEVSYVDFGNDEKCQMCNTRWLSENSASYPVQVVYCSLNGIQPLQAEDDWHKDLLTKFAEIVKDSPLVAVTQSYTDDGICEVDLYVKDEDISINQRLIQLGLVREFEGSVSEDGDNEPEALKLPDEKEWDFYVSFINQSSNSVVGRLVGDQYSEKLDDYDRILAESYKTCTTECTIEEDNCYIAYVDELYHRIRVLSINDQMAECYFLDHGDSEILNKSCLKFLDPAVNKLLPYQALEVSLYGLEEIATNPTTLEKLLDLALAKALIAEVVSREDGLSVILFDTSNEQDININEVIAKAVMEETEARMMAQGDFQPVSADISPSKSATSKSKDLEGALQSLKIDVEQKTENSEEIIDDGNDSDESWETEEEEEVVVTKKTVKKLKDKNRNTIKNSVKNKSESTEVTSVSKSPSEEISKKTLYTWGKSNQEKEHCDYMDDEKSLWNHVEYWKRPLPPPVTIPERGEYFDCHVTKVFDPTNFVCIPYGSMPDFNQILQDCIEYYNLYCSDTIMKQDEIKIGHLYAGHQGGAWYRILVNKIVGPGLVSVYIVDFGEYNAMALEEVKPLPWKFFQLPFQAFKCKLHGIKPIKDTKVWSEGAKFKMTQMAQEKSLVGLVCGKDESGVISLRLVDTGTDEDVCLDEMLIDLEMADVIKN